MRSTTTALSLVVCVTMLFGCSAPHADAGTPVDSSIAAASSAPTPVFVYVDTNGKGEGEIGTSIIAYKMDEVTGKLARTQVVPFHSPYEPGELVVNSSGTFAYVVNLNSDKLSAYSIDAASGKLTLLPGAPAAGKGLEAVGVAPSGNLVYAADNFTNRNHVYGFRVDPKSGSMTAIPGSPFLAETGPVDVKVDPMERFVYVVNQGSANVSGYTIDSKTGALGAVPGSPPTAGSTPWSLAFDPQGNYAFVIGYDGIFVFAIDRASGALTRKPNTPIGAKYRPVSITFDASGSHAFVVERQLGISTSSYDEKTGTLSRLGEIAPPSGSDFTCLAVIGVRVFALSTSATGASSVSTYTEDPKTGTLSPVAGSTVAAGDNASCIVAVKRQP